jgi:hypothetical protein
MKTKLAVIFATAALSLASAKSYSVSFSSPAKAGLVDLQAGDYNVSLDGSKVKFTSVRTGKSVEADATVQQSEKKFATTSVDSEVAAGASKIHEIDLGGTTTKLLFQ